MKMYDCVCVHCVCLCMLANLAHVVGIETEPCGQPHLLKFETH